jgi:hypothetical protein
MKFYLSLIFFQQLNRLIDESVVGRPGGEKFTNHIDSDQCSIRSCRASIYTFLSAVTFEENRAETRHYSHEFFFFFFVICVVDTLVESIAENVVESIPFSEAEACHTKRTLSTTRYSLMSLSFFLSAPAAKSRSFQKTKIASAVPLCDQNLQLHHGITSTQTEVITH